MFPHGWRNSSSTVDRLLSQLADVRAGKSVAQCRRPLHCRCRRQRPHLLPAARERSGRDRVARRGSSERRLLPVPRAPARALDRAIKVAAQTLNRLMGLAGESLVQSRWFEPFSESLLDLKRRHSEIHDLLESLQPFVEDSPEGSGHAGDGTTEGARNAAVGRGTADRSWMGSGFARRACPIVSIARSWRAGCGRSATASRAFRVWFATWRASSASRCSSRSSAATTEVDREILDRLEAPLQPRDSQQPGPRHRAARGARRGRQAAIRHDPSRSAPSGRAFRPDGVGRWPRSGHRSRCGPS